MTGSCPIVLRRCVFLVHILSTLSILSALAAGWALPIAAAEPNAADTGHRYVLLLGGFNSSSATREGAEVSADFARIERAIRGDAGTGGVNGLRSVVYFSYGSAGRLQ